MIGILSDIHGNLPALKAVLAAGRGLGCRRFISLGDVVGYYAQPGECIDLLREHEVLNIMGNHDHYMVEGLACPRSRMVSEIMTFQRCVVTPAQVAWLARSMPMLIEGDTHFVHGGRRTRWTSISTGSTRTPYLHRRAGCSPGIHTCRYWRISAPSSTATRARWVSRAMAIRAPPSRCWGMMR
ncbi:metallophosphoesterase family protein [Cupriavidus basilensis]